jgi:asparagine synthase (glutamine-hydrolysing)
MDVLLNDAVRARLMADVPLGVFLSGGLDSSAVAYYASKHHPRVETFSMAFEDPTYDESGYADAVARRLGTDHRVWTATAADLVDVVQSGEMPMDEPLGDTSIVPTYLLAKATRGHVTVALGGDGGDELFAGYPTFQAEVAAKWMSWVPPAAWRSMQTLLSEYLPSSDQYLSSHFAATQFTGGMMEDSRYRHQRWLGSFSPAEARRLLHPDLAAQTTGGPYPELQTWAATSSG